MRYDWGLPRDDRDHFEFELCYALKRLVVFYIAHDQSKVENAAVRWLEVNRRITKYQYGFEEAIAEALHFLAAHHREQNRIDEAVKEYSEAFEVRQDIENHDVAWDEDVVDALYELGKKLLQQGDRDKAEEVLSRTLDFRRRLAEKNPEKYAKAVTEAEAALKECQR